MAFDTLKMNTAMVIFMLIYIHSSLQAETCIPKRNVLNDFIQPYTTNGRLYYISKDAFTNELEAVEICQSICGYLAEVNDEAEMKILKSTIDGEKIVGLLIGGNDKHTENYWFFDRSGKQVNYMSWNYGEPNNSGHNEDCLELHKSYERMNDISCQSNIKGNKFVCEVELAC